MIRIQSGARFLPYLVKMTSRIKLVIAIKEPVKAPLTKYCATMKASEAVWRSMRGRFFLTCMLTTVQIRAMMPKACSRIITTRGLSMGLL